MCRSLILAGVLASVTTATAMACERHYALEYDMGPGDAVLSVNSIFYQKMSCEDANLMNFIAWIEKGENEVTVAYSGDGSATFWLISACRGSWDNDIESDKIVLSDGEQTSFSFSQEIGVDPSFAKTAPTDDAGLADAYAAFRQAVEERDAPTVMAVLEEFIERADKQGFARADMVAHLTRAVEIGALEIAQDGAFEAVADGRVYQRLTPDRQPTIIARYESDTGGQWTVPLGTYWAKLDGTWQIIYN
ncbi:MAG: hypothetical protein AAF674_08375 [Pseudomonadota bacterium]